MLIGIFVHSGLKVTILLVSLLLKIKCQMSTLVITRMIQSYYHYTLYHYTFFSDGDILTFVIPEFEYVQLFS